MAASAVMVFFIHKTFKHQIKPAIMFMKFHKASQSCYSQENLFNPGFNSGFKHHVSFTAIGLHSIFGKCAIISRVRP